MATRTMATADPGLAKGTDVIAFLIGQYMMISDLFAEVSLSQGDSRAEAFERCVKLLAAPSPPTASHPPDDPRHGRRRERHRDEHIAEEAEAKTMLPDLERMGPDDSRLPALLEHSARPCCSTPTTRRPASSVT